jgi:hypothetical protein
MLRLTLSRVCGLLTIISRTGERRRGSQRKCEFGVSSLPAINDGISDG